MKQRIRLELPYPPSANKMWRAVNVGGRVRNILSREGRAYRASAVPAVAAQVAGVAKIAGDAIVFIEMLPPDRRRRDLDNIIKPVLDTLTKGGVWSDDYQVVEIHAVRSAPCAHGKIIVEVHEC